MKTINRALGVSALALAFVVTGCSAGGSTGATPAASPGITAAPSSAPASSEANAADQMFVTMMIPHHEQAIEMSDIVLEKDDIDPRVLDLAQRIKDAQGPEIEQMEAWLDDWGMGHGGMGGMDHGDGMMSEGDMEALDAATGNEASRLWLQQMIEHHEGAVEMAEAEVEDGQHPDVVALAQQMADAQATEIAEMEQLLTEL
ncbi:uncharacterized protein (DUF305 family) [Agrococcus sp. UYP10]|uniref:DUF305 domain-containing protein n=1 Tax=Agrococcus sp. UYP10 TaxID=1756355 RepID=UPI003393F66B